MTPSILFIDTSSNLCTVGLSCANDFIYEVQPSAKKHSEYLLPLIHSLIQKAGLSLKQLDAIAYCSGPGSFTGIRLATSTVQGIALGADIPAIGLSTLQAIAQSAHIDGHNQTAIHVVLDARLGNVYYGKYLPCKTVVVPQQPDNLYDIAHIDITVNDDLSSLLVGDCIDLITQSNPSLQSLPTASIGAPLPEAIHQLALDGYTHQRFHTAEDVQPVYLQTPKFKTVET